MEIIMIAPYENDISVHPSIYQCARVLKENNIDVMLVTSNTVNDAAMKAYFSKIICLPYFKHRNAAMLFVNSIMFSLTLLKQDAQCFMIFDHHGAEAAMFVPLFLPKANYIYFNLEVFTPQGINPLKYKIRKGIEKWFYRKCRLFVIQDEGRNKLSKKYGITCENPIYIPNSYIYENQGKYYDSHRPLKLLYTGALERWSVEKLFFQLDKLKDIDVTLAGWSQGNYLENNVGKLEKYKNIHVCRQRLEEKEYTWFVGKYDIGLIYYSWTENENIWQMGLASGKFFKFLSLGKPVIVPRMPGIAEEVEKYGLGIVYDDLSEIKDAVSRVEREYDVYQKRIISTYKERYDFRKCMKEFVERVKEYEK